MCLVLQTCITNSLYFCLLQAELSKKEAQTADLQENIKSQQAETAKEKDELTSTLATMEKLKESFNKERADWNMENPLCKKEPRTHKQLLNRW